MTRVGNSGELGKDARVPGANFIELDVGDRLQAPIQTRSLGVGERWGELLEFGCVQEEEMGAKTIDGHTVLAVSGLWYRDVVEDSEAGAGGFELGSNNFEKVGDFETFKVEGTGRGGRGDGSVGGRGFCFCGGDAGSERGAGEALLEGAALLLSALLSSETLDRGAVAGLLCVDFIPVGWDKDTEDQSRCFRDILNDCADVTRHVMVWVPCFAAQLENVSNKLRQVAVKTRLGVARGSRGTNE